MLDLDTPIPGRQEADGRWNNEPEIARLLLKYPDLPDDGWTEADFLGLGLRISKMGHVELAECLRDGLKLGLWKVRK